MYSDNFRLIIFFVCWMCAGAASACCTVLPENEQAIPNMSEKETEKETEEILKQCYLDMYRTMLDKDSTGLEKVLDDSFVLIHMTGMWQSKKEFIRAVSDGVLNYYTAGHDEIRVMKTDGDYGSLVGRSRVSAAVFGGGRHTWRLQQELKLVRRNNRWFIAEARASTY